MIPRTIAVTTHGRYLVVSPANSRPSSDLLVSFHGYAEPAAAAMERLQTIPDAGHWRLVAIQGLNRFYRGRSTDVVASWMTREDRELAIADNVSYVSAVIDAPFAGMGNRRAAGPCRVLARRGDGLPRRVRVPESRVRRDLAGWRRAARA